MILFLAPMASVAAQASPQTPAQTPPAPAAKPSPLEVAPKSAVLCAGESITFHATRGETAAAAEWTLDPPVPSAASRGRRRPAATASEFTYTAPERQGAVALVGSVTLTARATDPDEKVAVTIELAGICDAPFGGELARFTVGYEQIGAAGIDSEQRYSFDVFMSRPLPFFEDRRDARTFYLGPPLRWWGDVRVGSYPQQVNTEVAKFAAGFAGTAGKLKVNELVRSAEFQTGLEGRIWGSSAPRQALTEKTQQRVELMAFAGWGGVGPLPPVSDATVFAVPAEADSPQLAAFTKAYPDVKSKYVAFVPRSANRFLEQASVGLRLYTFTVGGRNGAPQTSAPAIVEVSYGRHKLVSEDHAVVHASAFYPFAFGDRTRPDTVVIYFFGDALMARDKSLPKDALFLAPALDASNAAVPLTNANVTVVPVSTNNKDTYRVGVAIDLMRLWKRLSAPASEEK